ncbi:EcsC family protein [Merdimonas faecis]|uniref:EcsC family protein n=1 Tax=Merdimonas faecis TaxID=1653435 RepID=UPI0008637BDD|nr:EcsC family protein [Merdimonas faecis]
MFRQNRWEKEWTALKKKEARYLMRRREEKTSSALQQKLEEKIPEKLEETLNTAFIKAFDLVFEKGTGLIEKTYNKDQQKTDYQVREYAAGLKESRKTVKAFGRQSQGTRMKNLMISGVEGVGLGLLGIGLPDIPLFTAVILKSVYEIALSYGFEYESEKEQWFILKMIETALKKGEELERNNSLLNAWIDQNGIGETVKGRKEQSKETAAALAEALLYMKFLQGIPVVGVAGGAADTVYLKKITDYAELKYKRRFLRKKI